VRTSVLTTVADAIDALPADGRRVAVDGVDGAGKTHFADELAAVLRDRGTAVVRASVDGFHQPRAVRYRRGRGSPEGCYHDTFDYPALRRLLLDPLGPGGSRTYVPAIYDWQTESPLDVPPVTAAPDAILILDGIFTHRDELRDYWDYSVWLDVPFDVSVPRGAARGYGDPDPAAASNHRYVEGQRLYMAECAPWSRASVVIDNTDLARPIIR
jgi:uridine kinase